MNTGRLLRDARHAAALSQRELGERTGIPQPAIARIESGRVSPRVDTLDQLLEGCGRELAVVVRPGAGVDRTAMRELLALTPRQRLRRAVLEARNLARLLEGASR